MISQPEKFQRLAALSAEGQQTSGSEPGKGEGKGKQGKTKEEPEGKGKGPPQNPNREPCKFFESPNGCRFGPACSNYHPRLQPTDGRCFACGSSKHSQSECPRREAPEPSAKQKAQAKKAQVADPKTADPKTTDPKTTDPASVSKSTPKSSTPTKPASSTPQPKVSALAIEPSSGLLDGGATHALRAALPGEWENARDINVSLATGQVQLRITSLGTLLSQDVDQQPILPLGVAIEHLGLKVSWIGEICSVVHPCRGRLKVVLRRGCPEINRALCLDRIKELEAAKSASYASPVQQARLQCSEQLSKVSATFPQLDQVKDRVHALRTWFLRFCLILLTLLLLHH